MHLKDQSLCDCLLLRWCSILSLNIFVTLETTKHFFVISTDAHNYKIIGMLKTIKIPTTAPTCFGSRRNHHKKNLYSLEKLIVNM